jgi:HAD superfamily hydrolase (TIGR01484 family)
MNSTPTSSTAWSSASDDELRQIRGICLDIDDTLTTRGKLTSEAYASLWKLKRAGYYVIPITGRPAGWCDQIARYWPVDAVVGENGAFTFFMQDGVRRRINTPGAQDNPKQKLDELGKKILKRFPQSKWASDQQYREYDLAIDVCEDVPAWPRSEIDALLTLCSAEGAHAKLSSIHVNAWFGDYDKRKGLDHWLNSGTPGLNASSVNRDELLFIGDSPNDEPLFACFCFSVGVANIKLYLDRLKHPPRWMTERQSGAGFAEMAKRLVSLRLM